MGDGSGHSNGGGVAREARGIESGLLFGGDAAGAVNELEEDFLKLPWVKVKDSLEVKLLPQKGEVYVLTRSAGRRPGCA